uniref:Kinesin-like protein n=1 Tax=Lygus hesperus TaxID=30085 RepID=A0A146KMD8_LYGHE
MASLKRSADVSVAAPANKIARPRVTMLGSRQQRGPADAANVNMNVYVRIRPLNTREQGCRSIASLINETTLVFDPKQDEEPFFFKGSAQKQRDINRKVNKNMLFEFNRVFDENSTNEEVFDATTKNIVKSVLEGYNCSVFAYGATGAGKTYTMLGSPDNPGITYRTIVELLSQIGLMEGWKITIGASYIEVYNENVRDLLHPDTGMLQLREEEGGRVVVAGLKVETIRSSDQLFSLLAEGNRNRSQHPTDSNAESSRSHAVFQVHVRMEYQTDVKLAKLSMIDLAGSERGAATGCKGLRFKEGSNINKSLLALGNCINALADGLRHVPYRDSKLTRLLKDSLGGNCQTMMIANVSPASLAFEDSYNTLKYATRAKSIKSKISKNVLSENLISVAQYRKVVDELKQRCSKLEAVVCNNVNVTNLQEWEQKIAAVMDEKKKLHKEMLTLQTEERLTGLRLKHKDSVLSFQDSGDDQTSNRTQTGIDQLNARLDTFRRRMEEYKPILAANKEKEEALEREIRAHPQLAPFLLHVLERYRFEILHEEKSICLRHQSKIAQLQAKQEERLSAAISSFPGVLKEFYVLLRAHGHLTKELDSRYQTALKVFGGLKAVSFTDENEELPEHERLLRLSMGPVHEKPVVTEEEMNNYKKTVTINPLPLKERSQNKINITTNLNAFKSTPLIKAPLKLTPSKNLFKNISFNKENSTPASTKFPAPSTPGATGRGAGFKAHRPNTLRTHPYGLNTRVNKSGCISKPTPIRMNKLAAARMSAAVR